MPDLTHDWEPAARVLERRPDERLPEGARDVRRAIDGVSPGLETMGYYTREDLPFYYALAEAFTICDGYHCSVIGPDRSQPADVDVGLDRPGRHARRPAGADQRQPAQRAGRFSWTTMPERLQRARGQLEGLHGRRRRRPRQRADLLQAVPHRARSWTTAALTPTYPNDFLPTWRPTACRRSRGCWLALEETEHPGSSAAVRARRSRAQVVEALMSHPKIWAQDGAVHHLGRERRLLRPRARRRRRPRARRAST